METNQRLTRYHGAKRSMVGVHNYCIQLVRKNTMRLCRRTLRLHIDKHKIKIFGYGGQHDDNIVNLALSCGISALREVFLHPHEIPDPLFPVFGYHLIGAYPSFDMDYFEIFTLHAFLDF